MLIYLGAFAVSVGIAAYGEHLRTKKNNEKGFYLCLALAVLGMPILLPLRMSCIREQISRYWTQTETRCLTQTVRKQQRTSFPLCSSARRGRREAPRDGSPTP